MKKLIETLKSETATLKAQYIEMTKVWAEAQVIRNNERLKRFNHAHPESARYRDENSMCLSHWTQEQKDAIIYLSEAEYHQEQKFKWNTPAWKFDRVKFVTRMEKDAEAHYEQSILKLAARIEKKGLNQKNLTTVTGHVGVNIETTLTDGEKTVRAWTIIASGLIQRPHYRYLIK